MAGTKVLFFLGKLNFTTKVCTLGGHDKGLFALANNDQLWIFHRLGIRKPRCGFDWKRLAVWKLLKGPQRKPIFAVLITAEPTRLARLRQQGSSCYRSGQSRYTFDEPAPVSTPKKKGKRR